MAADVASLYKPMLFLATFILVTTLLLGMITSNSPEVMDPSDTQGLPTTNPSLDVGGLEYTIQFYWTPWRNITLANATDHLTAKYPPPYSSPYEILTPDGIRFHHSGSWDIRMYSVRGNTNITSWEYQKYSDMLYFSESGYNWGFYGAYGHAISYTDIIAERTIGTNTAAFSFRLGGDDVTVIISGGVNGGGTPGTFDADIAANNFNVKVAHAHPTTTESSGWDITGWVRTLWRMVTFQATDQPILNAIIGVTLNLGGAFITFMILLAFGLNPVDIIKGIIGFIVRIFTGV